MPSHTEHLFTTSFGEQAIIRRTTQGNILCPVCGYEEVDSSSWDLDGYVSSLDICPICNLQHGFDDIDVVPADPSNPIMLRWRKLRIQWLDRVGWPEWSIQQLQERLDLGIAQLQEDKELFKGHY